MRYPRIKRAALCRAIIIAKFLLISFIPVIIACLFKTDNSLLNAVIILSGLLPGIFVIVYLIKNYSFLMTSDALLSLIRNTLRARKKYISAEGFSEEKILSRAERFGRPCNPAVISPRPETLRCRSDASMTVWSGGIEKIIAVYRTDRLDKDCYSGIISSAKANSKALKGKKRRFQDSNRKSMDPDRVAVVIILAKTVDLEFGEGLWDRVVKDSADGRDGCLVPCVVDLAGRSCVFDGMADPYIGFGYPVKNRGLRIIRRMVFGGKLPLDSSPDTVELPEGLDAEENLWSFLKRQKKELVLDEKNERRIFESMNHGDVVDEDGIVIYVKCGERGVYLIYTLDKETMTAEVEEPLLWQYPKSNLISDGYRKEIYRIIDSYFANLGYAVKHGLD